MPGIKEPANLQLEKILITKKGIIANPESRDKRFVSLSAEDKFKELFVLIELSHLMASHSQKRPSSKGLQITKNNGS